MKVLKWSRKKLYPKNYGDFGTNREGNRAGSKSKSIVKKDTKWGRRFNWQSPLYEERRKRRSSAI